MSASKVLAAVCALLTGGLCSAASTGEVIELQSGSSRCRVETLGARVVSYACGGEEVLWNAPETPSPDSVYWINGGVPICWPWFSRIGSGDADIHGYAWKTVFSVRSRTADSLVLVTSNETSELEYTIRLTPALELALKVTSRSKYVVPLGIAFHPYFRVGDVAACSVEGLQEAPLTLNAMIDKSFSCSPSASVSRIVDPVLKRTIVVTADFATEVNVWNPWESFPGIEGDSWRRMLCVEPILRGPRRWLAFRPGEVRNLKMKVEVVK